jgi:hypothetical protein
MKIFSSYTFNDQGIELGTAQRRGWTRVLDQLVLRTRTRIVVNLIDGCARTRNKGLEHDGTVRHNGTATDK